MTNNSIFTRVLALVLCFIMVAGMMTSCFQEAEPNQGVSTETPSGSVTTPSGTTKPDTDTTTTTGDSANNDPVEDPVDPNEIYSGSTTLSMDDLIYGTLANNVFIGDENGVAAMIPADVKVEAGASALALSVTKVEEEALGDTLSNLDVHVSGIALDNTVPMTVMLGAILPIGLANTELKLYHVENGTPVLMMRVDSAADFAIHNQYVYDAETGNVTIYVASFSVFTAVQTTVSKWDDETVVDKSWYNEDKSEFTIENVGQFLGFRDLVDAGTTFEGKTVTLATDIDLDKKLFNPIGGGWAYNGGKTFNGTFDGGNHTIYNLRVNGWELDETGDKHSGTSNGAGLFSSLHNATIKNLAVVGSELIVETTSIGIIAGCAQGQCTFENIVVSDATLGNYQMRNGGIVGDIYVIASDNVPEGAYSHTFKNIVVDSSVKLSSMWGDFDTGNGGVIGGKYGSTTKVLMQNVIVAAELDVFSDVTAAYQWYAYRRCGMLIGYTGQNSPKQATNASADFLKCENVSVYYGDWTNYTYYQFNEQDSSTGQRYPWVRAEESLYNPAFSNVRYGVPTFDGVKVSNMDADTLNAKKSGFAAITFNQLYGGGQGVYGAADHNYNGGGVNRSYSAPKTFYIENNLGWTNLKLHYTYNNGEDTWTTIVDGIELFESNGVYRVDLPIGATSFTVTADGGFEVKFTVAELTEKETYPLHTHNFAEGSCSCGATQITNKYEFTLGENGSSGHKDNTNAQTTYTETTGKYTLSITDGVKVYPSSNDEIGNSCLKLGAGEAIGSFKFIVPENVNSVIIAVAGYKAKTVTIEVNGATHAITTLSDNGAYTTITVDTSTNKTVEFKTTSTGYRCMINTITFVVDRIIPAHTCEGTATCEQNAICNTCDKEIPDSALGHDYSANPYKCARENCGNLNLPNAGSSVTLAQAELIAQAMGGEKTENVYKITGTITKELTSTDGATTLTDGIKNIYVVTINNYSETGKGSVIYKNFVNKESFAINTEITLYGNIGLHDEQVRLYGAYLTEHTVTTPATCQNAALCDICGVETQAQLKCKDTNDDGNCDNGCGLPVENEPVNPETPVETTVSMDIFANKGSLTNKVITWTSGDVTVSNAQGSSTTAIRTSDSDHHRVYKSSTLKISVSNATLTKVVITCTSGYVNGVSNGAKNAGYSVETNGTVVTITGSGETEISFTASEQARITKVEVTYTTAGSGSEGGNNGGSEGGETECTHSKTTTTTVNATCITAGSTTVTCDDCGETLSTETIEALGHTFENGSCQTCGADDPDYNEGGETEPTEPTVVLEITKDDFTTKSYADNNKTHTKNGYSYTSYQVMNQSSVMQWQKSKGYITIASNDFVKLELKSTAGTFTVTVGGKTVTGTTTNGITTYDLTGLTGEIKISVGSATGNVEYIKFYK